MKVLIGLIALLSCTFIGAQTRAAKPVPAGAIRKIDRDLALEHSATARSNKLAARLQPGTRAKLQGVAGDLVSRISGGSGDFDPAAFARREISARFPKLSPEQMNLLSFFVLSDALSSLKSRLDGMNEMSEMTSLRLQMTMDRRSKFISTLSQIMKKISSTSDTIVQNIK